MQKSTFPPILKLAKPLLRKNEYSPLLTTLKQRAIPHAPTQKNGSQDSNSQIKFTANV